jgi:uncharacterized membrane protein YbaN (DUF454 family)
MSCGLWLALALGLAGVVLGAIGIGIFVVANAPRWDP